MRRMTVAPWLVLATAACSDAASPDPVPLGFGPVVEHLEHRTIDVGFRGTDGVTLSGALMLPKKPGRYPVLVMHFGSDRWTRAKYEHVHWWTDNGIAVLTYDKRGVGKSGGRCCPWREPTYFELLGGDVLAGARLVATHAEIDPRGIGAWGFSQGGWVIPVAASRSAGLIAWAIIGSGPTVTLGEELLYSELTGDDNCKPSGLSAAEIERRMDAAGPSLFDPKPYLRSLTASVFWIYGGLDTSIPVHRSVRVIDELAALGKDYTALVIANLNHTWITNGGMCQHEGVGGVEGSLLMDWLRPRLVARGVWAE